MMRPPQWGWGRLLLELAQAGRFEQVTVYDVLDRTGSDDEPEKHNTDSEYLNS
jgi:hypothetical protein